MDFGSVTLSLGASGCQLSLDGFKDRLPHVWAHDDRHTGLPRYLPQLRCSPRLLRWPVEDPKVCAARWGNAMHGRGTEDVLAVSRGGTLLHAPAGARPTGERDGRNP